MAKVSKSKEMKGKVGRKEGREGRSEEGRKEEILEHQEGSKSNGKNKNIVK